MILQALVQYYEDLVTLGQVQRQGWGPVKVSYALELNDEGKVVKAFSVMTEQQKENKQVFAPQIMTLPAQVKKTSGIVTNFMCENSAYVLGVDRKENKGDRARRCFENCRDLHFKLLSGVNSPGAKAVVRFFEQWNPDGLDECSAVHEMADDLLSGGNIVFYYDGGFVHDDSEVRAAWQRYYCGAEGQILQRCLVTGQIDTIDRLHPSIKGIKGAAGTGAALVSFNNEAFCSYGKKQGQNAPTGKYAAFAYGTALNYLLSDKSHIEHIGDTTVVFWARGGEVAYQDAFSMFAFGKGTTYTSDELRDMLLALCKGKTISFNERNLDPQQEFYVLGIAPNKGRLAVRFFWKNSFNELLSNIEAHRKRLEILPVSDKYVSVPLWLMLNETVNQKSSDKSPSSVMAGEVLRAVLNDTRYPATLLNGVTLRIRAEHNINRGRAAIIKAYYLKNRNPDVPEEVLTVSLNRESTNVPYVLGRLFSVLEQLQERANPGINATIKDKYFNSASSTPATVFPVLMNLAQKHLRKLEPGIRVYYEKKIGEITELLTEEYPQRLNLPKQGSFQLGYYHETQARYQKKD